ncbi:glycosyltransferase [Flexithrix dorotheae]|uniref:glycosyltransferase n=1 Tax=Flexithrix dorotheae TaxID=70993 RepID=UPI000378FA45|nr:glycosyltransferase [Flexithrix dorotheae]
MKNDHGKFGFHQKPHLVILTTHFGNNFSGGSTATCEIFYRIEDEFEDITVLGTQLGTHPFKEIKFIKYHYWFQAFFELKKLHKPNTIFYGDFYNSFLFVLAGVPYYFTYHDNWPELSRESTNSKWLSFFYTPVYQQIFKKAGMVFTVSKFKYEYILNFTPKVQLVYNGFEKKHGAKQNHHSQNKKAVMMVGNIDKRKYKMALQLFRQFSEDEEIEIDIYGNKVDKGLAQKLSQFHFVNLKGFHKNIPFSNYKLLLHTSISESFGMVFCEAIHAKIPVLAFDTGGAKELINKENGILIPPYKISIMKEELMNILEGKIPFRFNSNSLEKFSWENAGKNYLNYMLSN